MSEKIDEISVVAELLGIKSWLEFYGKDFFPEELFDDLHDKIRECEEIAFKNKEMVEYRAFHALQILLSGKKDFRAITEAFEVLHDLFLLRTEKIRKIDFLRAVDRIEKLIYKRRVLRTKASKEEKEGCRVALEAFDFKKSVKEAIKQLLEIKFNLMVRRP
jgi:hypothetical protein